MPTDTAESSNGRVTLAVISQQITTMQHTLDEIRATAKEQSVQVRENEINIVRLSSRTDDNAEEIKMLRVRSNTWDWINSVVAAIAAILAGYIGTK